MQFFKNVPEALNRVLTLPYDCTRRAVVVELKVSSGALSYGRSAAAKEFRSQCYLLFVDNTQLLLHCKLRHLGSLKGGKSSGTMQLANPRPYANFRKCAIVYPRLLATQEYPN